MKRMIALALALCTAASVAVVAQARPAAGESRDGRHRSADVTFTKWGTNFGGSMAGVVGGDVGPGDFVGRVIREDTTSKPGFWLAQALYGFFGTEHSFVADNSITEDITTGTATIRGVVIWGWMRGARVTGEYTLLDPCPIPTPGNVFGSLCIEGTLHLRLGRHD